MINKFNINVSQQVTSTVKECIQLESVQLFTTIDKVQ